MQWSKLKSKVKDFICSELKDRVDLHLTSYRKSHDGADKVWITVDGKKVFSCKHYPYEFAERSFIWEKLTTAEIKSKLVEHELHNPKDFGDAMRCYLNIPINDALQSENPLIKAFAIIDRRVGKRTLENLNLSESEHSLVKTFYELRRNLKQ